ncbi:MAG: choice-of-anchor D domain-containing protein [Herbiconiux sp.]|nr:choice-of-anchor D domain-containing protein [Herbiconiux sp.]
MTLFSRSRPRVALLAGALLAALTLPLLGGLPASAAPGDDLSISIANPGGDFGYRKTGTTLTRTITLTNDGAHAVTISPTPLSTIAAPFAFKSTTIVAGDVIAPGATRTIVVDYTAPAAGTVSNLTIPLKALDQDVAGGTLDFGLSLMARSLATDRAFFVVKTPDGAPALAFGSVQAGATVTKRLQLEVQGIDDLKFSTARVGITDGAGAPVPSITIATSSFGTGVVYHPGETATVDLRFSPTAAGTFAGNITITGETQAGNPEAPSIVIATRFTATATAGPTPTPSPTPTPTSTPAPTGQPTPAPTSTATPGGGTGDTGGTSGTAGTGGTGIGGSGSGSGSGTYGYGSGSGSLAHTGSAPAVAVGVAGIMLLLGVASAAVTLIGRRKRTVR